MIFFINYPNNDILLIHFLQNWYVSRNENREEKIVLTKFPVTESKLDLYVSVVK